MYIFDIYHQQTKRIREKANPPPPKEEWPDSWKTTYIKNYPRFEVYKLPSPTNLTKPISECLLSRHSHRTFSGHVTLDKLSNLIFYSIGKREIDKDGNYRRMYPSAGARYPLEFYILNFNEIEDLKSGIYHYNIESHGLTLLKKREFNELDRLSISPETYTTEAKFAIIGTGTIARSADKYSEKAYRFSIFEMGACAQNLALCAEALGIGSVNTGGIFDDVVEDLLQIDGTEEKVLHAIFFG